MKLGGQAEGSLARRGGVTARPELVSNAARELTVTGGTGRHLAVSRSFLLGGYGGGSVEETA